MAGVKIVGNFVLGIKMVNKRIWNGKWKLNALKPFYFAKGKLMKFSAKIEDSHNKTKYILPRI
jgi:hypothetical protein